MSTRIRPVAAALGVLLLASIGATPAGALSISPNPLALDTDPSSVDLGFAGVLTLVDVVSGVPAGGSVLAGSVAGGDVTLVFQASLAASASENALFLIILHPESLDAGYAGVRYTGIGTIPGAGHDVGSGSLAGTYAYALLTGAGMAPGASMDLVFVSIPSLAPGTPFGAALANVGSYAEGEAQFVPEPAGVALLAVGLALACGGRGLGSRMRA